MGQIRHIKSFYKPKEAQKDLREDAITLLTMNMIFNFVSYEGRYMTDEEINFLVRDFRSKLKFYNNIDVEWNQTS